MGESSVISPASFATLGELLRYLRERAHLSQRELAAQVNYHYSTISRIEKNNHIPDLPTLMGRFVPALDLEDKPEWIARITVLASPDKQTTPTSLPSPSIASQPDLELVPLPIHFSPLLGRERETDALWEMLRRADIRLVTLIGPPGVGKTRLAIHAAQQVTAWFPDGFVFADLTPVSQVEQVIPALAASFGIPETEGRDHLVNLQSRLRNKRMLIVLDNFEQVIDAAPQIARLLAGSPDLKILATSREALRISAEHIFPLQPLPLPESISTNNPRALLDYPAVRLFVERATAVRPDFTLTEENATYVTEICARLDGLPLAIELAAARVNLLAPREMLEQFDRRFQWLTHGTRDSHTWRQTLRGALEWSMNLLNEEELTILMRLSIFAGGWTLQAAEAVCATDKDQRDRVLPVLMQLAGKSLVVADPEHGRYRFLETLREFIHEKLIERGELQQTRARHLAYFAGWAENLEQKLDEMSLNESRRRAEAERNNIYAALTWALENEDLRAEGLRLITAVSWIWFQHSHFSEGCDWAERFLPFSLSPQFKPLRVRLLYRTAALAEFAYWRMKHRDIKSFFEEAESLAREMNDKTALAHALFLHTEVYLDDQDWEHASLAAHESSQLCRELGQNRLLCMALSELGIAQHNLGQKTKARASLNEALDIAAREKYVRGEGYALRKLVQTLRLNGEFVEAVAVNQRALQAIRASGDRINIGQVLVTMAIITNALDDFEASGRYAQDAYDMFQSIGSEFQQPFPQRLAGYAALHTGDPLRARQLCLDSIKRNLALDESHVVGVFGGLLLLAEIELAEGNAKQAARLVGFVNGQRKSEPISFQEPDTRALERLQRLLAKKKGVAAAEKEGARLPLAEVLRMIEK